ncbi:MAG: SH3 domain-containing protein [Spirochaetes bacterium]|nr:SH3 domain-containing protein [Spirochaetota bacterium]
MIKFRFLIFAFIILLVNSSFCSSSNFTLKDKIDTKSAMIVVNNLNFRSSPNLKSKSLGKLMIGDIVEIISIDDNKSKIDSMEDYWYKVKHNNKNGYVFGFFLSEFDSSKIIKNEKNGIVIFLDDKNKVVSSVEYESYYGKKTESEASNQSKNNAQIAELINDNFVILKNIYFYYSGSEYITESFKIYGKDGKEITSADGLPYVFYSNYVKYLIVIKALNVESYKVQFQNEIEIYSIDGELVKNLKVDMTSKYKDEFNKNDFILSDKEDKFLWVNNTKALVLNLKNIKQKAIEFKEIKKYNPDSVFINLTNTKLDNNILKISLLPFNFEEGIDYDQITLTVNTKKY